MSSNDFENLDRKFDRLLALSDARLRKSYQGSLNEMREYLARIYALYGDGRNVEYSELVKYSRVYPIREEIIAISTGLYSELFADVQEDLKQVYGMSYDVTRGVLEKQSGKNIRGEIQLSALDKAIRSPVGGLAIDMRFDHWRDDVAYRLTQAVIGGASQGKTLRQVSRDLDNVFRGNSAHIRRIVETEGHRLMEQAKLDEAMRAEAQGIKTRKRWISLRDSKTRPAHMALHGTVKNLDENFISPSGGVGKAPGNMGTAEDDINCRCYLEIFVP